MVPPKESECVGAKHEASRYAKASIRVVGLSRFLEGRAGRTGACYKRVPTMDRAWPLLFQAVAMKLLQASSGGGTTFILSPLPRPRAVIRSLTMSPSSGA